MGGGGLAVVSSLPPGKALSGGKLLARGRGAAGAARCRWEKRAALPPPSEEPR